MIALPYVRRAYNDIAKSALLYVAKIGACAKGKSPYSSRVFSVMKHGGGKTFDRPCGYGIYSEREEGSCAYGGYLPGRNDRFQLSAE